MKYIDPEGVKERRAYVSQGANFCWHIDGGCNIILLIELIFLDCEEVQGSFFQSFLVVDSIFLMYLSV